jgi:hypothetical protein
MHTIIVYQEFNNSLLTHVKIAEQSTLGSQNMRLPKSLIFDN